MPDNLPPKLPPLDAEQKRQFFVDHYAEKALQGLMSNADLADAVIASRKVAEDMEAPAIAAMVWDVAEAMYAERERRIRQRRRGERN